MNPHTIVGIGAGIATHFLSLPTDEMGNSLPLPEPKPVEGVVDEWAHASSDEAIEFASKACKLEGMMVGRLRAPRSRLLARSLAGRIARARHWSSCSPLTAFDTWRTRCGRRSRRRQPRRCLRRPTWTRRLMWCSGGRARTAPLEWRSSDHRARPPSRVADHVDRQAQPLACARAQPLMRRNACQRGTTVSGTPCQHSSTYVRRLRDVPWRAAVSEHV